jgi:hypothetical protein
LPIFSESSLTALALSDVAPIIVRARMNEVTFGSDS